MIITAKQSNVSVTPRKLRLVVFAIKDLTPGLAVEQLTYLNKEAARVLVKVLKQALANAKNNFQITPDSLRFKEIIINKGRVLNRGRAASRGRSKPYQHVFSHVTIKLESVEPKKVEAKQPRGGRVKRSETSGSSEVKAVKKPVVKKEIKQVITKSKPKQ